MAKNNTLKVRITGDARDLRKATGKAQGHLQSLAGSAAKIGAAMASAFAVREIAQFGADLYQTGLDLEAWRVKASTVFEDQLGSVRKWADGLHVAFGMTDEELVNVTASMADLLKPMGFTAEQAAEMSMEVTELSGALAAWSGGQYEAADVSRILSKAMLGERESLKELGISITQAEVDQRALNIAMANGTGVVDAQTKALATQELIFEKSTDAQNAWNDGLREQAIRANKLKVAFAELKERLSSALIPAFTLLFEVLNLFVVPAVETLGDVMALAKNKMVGLVRDGLELFNKWWDSYGHYFTAFRDSVVGLVETGLARVSGWWDSVGGRVLGAFADFIVVLNDRAYELRLALTDLVEAGIDRAVAAFERVSDWVNANKDAVLEPLRKAFESVKDAVSPVTDAVTDLVDNGLSKLSEWFNEEGTFVSDFKDATGDLVDNGLSLVSGWWDSYGSVALDGLQTAVDKLREAFPKVRTVVVDLVDKGLDKLSDALDGIRSWWNDNKDSVFGAIKTAFENIKDAVSPITDAVTDLLDNAFDRLAEWFTVEGAAVEDFDSALQAVKEKFIELKDAALDLYRSVLEKISTWFQENTGKIVFFTGVLAGATVAFTLLSVAAFVATTGVTAFAAVMAVVTSPVFLVIAGFALLVGALVYLYYEFETARTIIDTAMNAVWDVIKLVFGMVTEAIGGVVDVVQGFIKIVKGVFNGDMDLVMQGFVQIIEGAFDFVMAFIMGFVDNLKLMWDLSFLGEIVDGALSAVLGFFQGAWDRVSGAVGSFWGHIEDAATGAKDWISEKLDDIVGFFTDLPGRIATAASGAWDGIATAFVGVLNFIIRGWNSLDFKLPDFEGLSIAGKQIIPGFTGPTLGVPDIPEISAYASSQGGIFSKPTLTWVGEKGMEAIVPFDRLPQGNTAPGASPLPAMGGGDVNVFVETDADPREVGAAVAWALATGGA